MAHFYFGMLEKWQKRVAMRITGDRSFSERGFTYLEVILSFGLISVLFPLSFGLFYQVTTDVRTQLNEHRLFIQFDRFQHQVQRDQANAVQIITSNQQLELLLYDDRAIRYSWKDGKIIRSVKERGTKAYRGHTTLLYYVSNVHATSFGNGVELDVQLTERSASYTGHLFIWGKMSNA
jgi:hypothetical protein